MIDTLLFYALALVVLDLGCKAADMIESPRTADRVVVFCCVVSAACIGYGTTLLGK